ncbi:unnamed protein product [Lymnaea stagnalis]|uniref:SOCS box domain-containing protein n=1 Tax=Lymnaea stagnalis TaxID=6523 RepID=A0AAV2IAN3_LYMST
MTDIFSRLKGGDLYQAISSGNLDDVIKLIETSDGKTNGVEQSTLDQGLLMACSGGRKFVVRHLLLKGASTETRDPMGNTPLLVSAERGFVEIARLLLDKGADVNALNVRDDSSLTLSVTTCGSLDMIGLLLNQKSINVNQRNKDGYTSWMKAVEALDFDVLKLLIKSGKDIDKDVNDCKGQTNKKVITTLETDSPAIQTFNVDAIISLIEDEAKGSKSSLRLAVFQHDLYCTRFFIDYGIFDADINNYDTELLFDFMEDIEDKQSKQCHVSETVLEIIRKLLQTRADVYLRKSYRADEVLVKAVNIGSYELVDLLCQHGADPNTHSRKPPYQNAVVTAAEKGRCDLLKVLMKYNANIHGNTRGLYGQSINSPIEAALQSGEVKVVKLLLKNGVSVNVEAGIHIAVTHKRLQSLRFLSNKFSDLARSSIHNNSKGFIHKAVETGNIDIINTLLDLGSNVNCLFDGKTPLMHADTPDVMELLIKRGADVNKQTNHGSQINIISYVIVRESVKERNRYPIVQLGGKDESPSSNINLKGMVEILLRKGARVNDSLEMTPLMAAAKQSDAEDVLRMLLEAGAEVNKVDSKGVSALYKAVVGGCLKNVDILIAFGADVNQKCNDGGTALHAAVDGQDAGGNIALLTAASGNRAEINPKVLRILLGAGSNVNHRNANGETALMKAACCLNDEAIKALCEANADVNMRSLDNMNDAISILVDRLCKTPKTHGQLRESIFYLLDRRGSSSCVSLQNLYYFILNGCLTIVQRLVEAGLGPSDIDAEHLPFRHRKLLSAKNVSPFCFALLCNEVKLARYFSDIWYLTNSDVTALAHDKNVRLHLESNHHNESLKFLEEFSSQPMSLQKLCFVAVSTSIGTGPDRERKIRDLPLPNRFKDKLMFSAGCAPELRFDDDQRDVMLWPARAIYDLVYGDLVYYVSDESDYEPDIDYERDYY